MRTVVLGLTLLLYSAAGVAVGEPQERDTVTQIHDIQGASHLSPYLRQEVSTRGIVTAVGPRGFYMESPVADDVDATSEGIFVDTYRPPAVTVGDVVVVSGRVEEEFPGGPSSGNLPVTTIKRPDVEIEARGRSLPPPVVIGADGRIPPGRVISNDSNGPAEISHFDPAEDGLDFYESLEGMRVRINEAVSVGTVHTAYGEIWVVADGGRHASPMTARGGIAVTAGDFNPERILVDYLEDHPLYALPEPPLPIVGDRFAGPINGIVSYSWYNYKVLPTADLPPLYRANLPREIASSVAGSKTRNGGSPGTGPEAGPGTDSSVLSVAAFNVQNLSARSPSAKFRDIARTIVEALHSPDIILLSEIQDGDGPARSGVTDSASTVVTLLEAIRAGGGPPDYRYADIAPEYNRDGGRPHANIRVGFLYRGDRARLDLESLERVSPDSRAFINARKPLAGRFLFAERTILVVANHFSSKSGDGPLFGRVQPPTAGSEPGRWGQAEEVRRYVERAAARDSEALVIVGGDLNDFAFSRTLEILKGDILINPADALPAEEVYSYVYEGNSQALDHILVNAALARYVAEPIDYVHRYAEYLYEERWSDHDPVLLRLRFESAGSDTIR